MDIKAKINEVLAALTWRVEHEKGARDLEITSDPWSRTHTIKMPTAGPDWRDIEYLHELAHATLAERHHLLSTAYFERGIAQSGIDPLINPIRTASDWFADDLLMQWCPHEEAAEIREHAGYILDNLAGFALQGEVLYGGGLFLAQQVHYRGVSLCLYQNRDALSWQFRRVVDILLDFDPSRPTVAEKRNLINRLAGLTCKMRVHITRQDGMDVWRIKK